MLDMAKVERDGWKSSSRAAYSERIVGSVRALS